MGPSEEFVSALLHEGRIVFRDPPEPGSTGSPAASAAAAQAFDLYRREVPGKRVEFDAGVALAAAEVVRQAAWAAVSRDRPVEWLARHLAMPGAPSGAAQHLSADLFLRYLPQVHRRALARDPSDPLVGLLERVLRLWPLSGVLAEIEEAPESTLDFGGHEGLMLLYAERLARRDRPAWRPGGRALEFVGLVLEAQAGARGAGVGSFVEIG